MLKVALSIFISLLITFSCLSQSEKEQADRLSNKNAIYLELLGSGLFYSINYDRILITKTKLALSGRIGLSYFPITNFWDFHTFSIPLELNLLIGKENKYFEIGLSSLYQQNFDEMNTSRSLFGSFRLGYRYQKNDDGLIYRIGLTPLLPIILDDEYQLDVDFVPAIPWIGFSVGYGY